MREGRPCWTSAEDVEAALTLSCERGAGTGSFNKSSSGRCIDGYSDDAILMFRGWDPLRSIGGIHGGTTKLFKFLLKASLNNPIAVIVARNISFATRLLTWNRMTQVPTTTGSELKFWLKASYYARRRRHRICVICSNREILKIKVNLILELKTEEFGYLVANKYSTYYVNTSTSRPPNNTITTE